MKLAGLLFTAILGTHGVLAQENDLAEASALASAELAHAAEMLDEAQGARNRVRALTETVAAYEQGLSVLRDGLRRGAIAERALAADFAAEEERLMQLTSALISIQRSPETILLLHPSGPIQTVRSGMLTADVVPALQSEATLLSARLGELRDVQALQRDALTILNDGLRGAQDARSALSQAMAERRELPAPYSSDPEAIQSLINSAETLDAFSLGLTEIVSEAPDASDIAFSAAQGVLPLPVDGLVLRRFAEADAAGIRRPGLILATAPSALVTAPWPATVRYAGPLLNYGNVIILEPENGYLLILAGIGEGYVKEGEVVDAGAPVGTMGGEDPIETEALTESFALGGQEVSETLYMELRQDQTPLDPSTWFLAQSEIGSIE